MERTDQGEDGVGLMPGDTDPAAALRSVDMVLWAAGLRGERLSR